MSGRITKAKMMTRNFMDVEGGTTKKNGLAPSVGIPSALRNYILTRTGQPRSYLEVGAPIYTFNDFINDANAAYNPPYSADAALRAYNYTTQLIIKNPENPNNILIMNALIAAANVLALNGQPTLNNGSIAYAVNAAVNAAANAADPIPGYESIGVSNAAFTALSSLAVVDAEKAAAFVAQEREKVVNMENLNPENENINNILIIFDSYNDYIIVACSLATFADLAAQKAALGYADVRGFGIEDVPVLIAGKSVGGIKSAFICAAGSIYQSIINYYL